MESVDRAKSEPSHAEQGAKADNAGPAHSGEKSNSGDKVLKLQLLGGQGEVCDLETGVCGPQPQ